MKQLLFALSFFCFTQGYSAPTDSTDTQKDSTLTMGFGQDSFFGPYTTVMGTYGITPKTQLVYYANYWANFAFANMTTGADFWTETGLGASFALAKGKMLFVPTVGITYGKVLSNGSKGVFGDGITPGFYTWLGMSRFELTQGAYYFRALRETGTYQNNFIWWWAALGYKVTPAITAGIHYDQLTYHSNDYEMSNLYVWFGPYVQYNTRQGHYLKVTSGYDAINGEYFKANLNIVIH